MARALASLHRAWWSIEIPGRFSDDTYAGFDFASLPPIRVPLDDQLSWLRAAPESGDSIGGLEYIDPSRKATLEELESMDGVDSLRLPQAFRNFIGSPELQARVPSCTACYLDLGDSIVPVVGGGHLIHFLSDQQGGLHWLLYVGDDGSEAVVVTAAPFGFKPGKGEKKSKRLPDVFDPNAGPKLTGDAEVAAETFSEFLYRFWIENSLWFTTDDDGELVRPLTPDEAAYVAHYEASEA
jgi:hypothetical protein